MTASKQTDQPVSPYLPMPASVPHIIEVDADKYTRWPDWKEIWDFRTTLWYLVVRDFKIRYKQTFLGVAWAIIQPITSMIIFSIFFGGAAGIKAPGGIPYPLWSFAGLVPWTYFNNGLSLASDSLLGQAHLVRKVYIPRLIIPLSRILGGFIDYVIALAVLFFLMLVYRYLPSWDVLLWLPLMTLMMMLLTLGLSLLVSALNVRYRDMRYLVPYALQVLTYATPIAWPSSNLHEPFRTLLSLNPMTTVVEMMRTSLLQTPSLSIGAIALSWAITLLLLIVGILKFRRAEGDFADLI